MVSVLKNEREKSERSFGTGPGAVLPKRARGRSRLLDEVCELCGYERKYASKVLSGKRAVVGSRKRGGSQPIYGVATRGDQSDLVGSRATLRKRLKAALKV